MSIRIIAEAGVNHNGSIALAKALVRRAAEAGADIVKFQTFLPERLASANAEKAAYQTRSTGANESQLAMLRRLALPFDAFAALKRTCEQCGVRFLSTPFDLESVAFLTTLGMGLWKIPSGEITNLPYLIAIAKTRDPVLLSTGMSDMSEIHAAVDALTRYGSGDITLLHCTTEYPAPYIDVNLNAILTLKQEFGLPVGFSDHTRGIEAAIAAAAMGAVVIEKHFTLDCDMEGPDHKASLAPNELAELVRAVRNVETAMGDGLKRMQPSERKNRDVARKSIVAARAIAKGETLTEENLAVKRPGGGVNPMQWFAVLGTEAIRDFCEDELIEL